MSETEENARILKFVNGEMSDYSLIPRRASTEPQTFAYFTPELGTRERIVRKLGLTDLLFAGVQVIKPGSANLMHSHSGMDGLYFVLKGRVRFYDEADELIGDLGPLQGTVIPRGTPYWFEGVGDEPAELLHIEAFDRRVPNKRTAYPQKSGRTEPPLVDAVE